MRSKGSEFSDFESELVSSAQSPAEDSLGVKRMLRLRLPLVIITTLVMAAVTVPTAWFLVPEEYTATADILFATNRPRIMNTRVADSQASSYDKFVSTQIHLITGNNILTRVLDSAEIQALPEIKASNDDLGLLKDHISARMERGSEIVTVWCTWPNREAAQLVLQETVQAYMDYAMQQEADTGGMRLNQLQKTKDSQRVALEAQLRDIAQLRSQLGASATGASLQVPNEPDLYRENLLKAEEDVAKAAAQVVELERQLEQIHALQESNRQSPEKEVYPYNVEQTVSGDPKVAALHNDVALAEVEVAGLEATLAPGSPRISLERAKLERIKQSLETMKRSVRTTVLSGLPAALERQVQEAKTVEAEAKQRVAKLEGLLKEYTRNAEENSAQIAKLEEMSSKAESTRRAIEAMEDQIREIVLESNAPARVQMASPPEVPPSPDKKKQVFAMLFALLGSGATGLGAGVLREFTDKQLRSPRDIARVTQAPVLATLPNARDDARLGSSDMPLLTEEYAESATADQFRRILSSIIYPREGVMTNSVLIVSPMRGDGRTSVACNLALALAQAHRNVLLVDLNHRRPEVEKKFGLDAAPGLAEVLQETSTLQNAARQTEHGSLWILGPGLESNGLATRLASRRMVDFLDEAESAYTHVIIDSPPSLVMSEANLLAPLVDAVIVVAGVSSSSAGMVQRCLNDMTQLNANVIGVVLNGVKRMRGGFLQENYHLYYGADERPRVEDKTPSSGNGRSKAAASANGDIDDEVVYYFPKTSGSEQDRG